jgi:hypothetical protein
MDLNARVPLTGGAQIAHLLGRIEATLTDMRRDIQSSVRTQEATAARMERIDLRVLRLEDREAARTRFSRVAGVIGLALLIPALNATSQLHGWYVAINESCFPRKP